MVARFVQEARAVNMIKHPSIVDIFEFDDLPDGRPFYVMELLEGIDLRSILNERGPLPARRGDGDLSSPSARRCRPRTSMGIVHRDLKASNIFIANVGGARVVKLLDFGIAKLMHPDAGEGGLTVVGTRLGTSYTMAPEQIRGDGVDARTDIYALGVVLYHLLTGQYPFRAETMTDIERQHLESPPPRPSQVAPVPPALDAVVLRCMEKTAERRFQTVKAFIEALRDAVGNKTVVPEVTARGAAILVEIRIADGADAESDEVLDDTSAILDATEQSLRGARDDAAAADGERDHRRARAVDRRGGRRPASATRRWRWRTSWRRSWARAPSAHADVHVNIVVHVGERAGQGIDGGARRQGGRGRRAAVDGRLGAAGERRRRPRDRRGQALTRGPASVRAIRCSRLRDGAPRTRGFARAIRDYASSLSARRRSTLRAGGGRASRAGGRSRCDRRRPRAPPR